MQVKQNIMKNKYEMDMCQGALLKKILIFTIPLMLSGIIQLLFNAVDMVIVGRYAGSESLAAVGSTSSLINLLINIFMGLSVGTNVMVSRFYGGNQEEELKEMVHTAIFSAIICGFILIFLGTIFAKPALILMGTPEDVINHSVLYLRIYFLGMPFFMVYNFGSAILRAVGDTKRPLYFLLFAGVINVVLNLILVINFNLGVAGVAIATVVSQFISAVLVVRSLVITESSYQLVLKELKIVPDKLLKMIKIGLPAGIQGAFFSLSNVLIQSSINSFGSIVMAGNSAASNMEGFVYISMNAFYQGAVSFTGQNLGGGQYKRIGKILLVCQGCVLVVGFVLGHLVYFLGPKLLGLYSANPEVIEHGMVRLSYISRTYLLCGMMEVMVGSLRGLGYSIMPMIVSLAGACGFRILWIMTVFKIYNTPQALYISYPISWFLTALVHFICFIFVYKNIEKKKT